MINHWFGRITLILGAVLVPLFVGSSVGGDVLDPASIQALMYGVAFVAVVGIEHQRRGSSGRASGLVPTPRSSLLTALGFGWAVTALATILLLALLFGARLEGVASPVFSFTGLSTIVLFAAGEEVVFRGTLLEALHERFGSTTAVLITSTLFALAHAGNPGASLISILNVGLAGVALGTAVVSTSSLWLAIGFHVTWNVLLSAVFGVVSGIDLGLGFSQLNTQSLYPPAHAWIAGAFGVEEGYLTTVLLLASVFCIAKYAPYDPYVRAARLRRSFSS